MPRCRLLSTRSPTWNARSPSYAPQSCRAEAETVALPLVVARDQVAVPDAGDKVGQQRFARYKDPSVLSPENRREQVIMDDDVGLSASVVVRREDLAVSDRVGAWAGSTA